MAPRSKSVACAVMVVCAFLRHAAGARPGEVVSPALDQGTLNIDDTLMFGPPQNHSHNITTTPFRPLPGHKNHSTTSSSPSPFGKSKDAPTALFIALSIVFLVILIVLFFVHRRASNIENANGFEMLPTAGVRGMDDIDEEEDADDPLMSDGLGGSPPGPLPIRDAKRLATEKMIKKEFGGNIPAAIGLGIASTSAPAPGSGGGGGSGGRPQMVDEADEETYDDPNLKDYQIRINNGRVIPMRRAESLATPTSARMAGGQDMPRHQSMAPQQHASNGSQYEDADEVA